MTAYQYPYELLRRLDDAAGSKHPVEGDVVWVGEDGGRVVYTNCSSNAQCGNAGECQDGETSGKDEVSSDSESAGSCVCNSTYYTLSPQQASGELVQDAEKVICGYLQIRRSFAIIVSVVFGGCGVDRCLLARGEPCGVCIGITKGVTIGACKLKLLVEEDLCGCDFVSPVVLSFFFSLFCVQVVCGMCWILF